MHRIHARRILSSKKPAASLLATLLVFSPLLGPSWGQSALGSNGGSGGSNTRFTLAGLPPETQRGIVLGINNCLRAIFAHDAAADPAIQANSNRTIRPSAGREAREELPHPWAWLSKLAPLLADPHTPETDKTAARLILGAAGNQKEFQPLIDELKALPPADPGADANADGKLPYSDMAENMAEALTTIGRAYSRATPRFMLLLSASQAHLHIPGSLEEAFDGSTVHPLLADGRPGWDEPAPVLAAPIDGEPRPHALLRHSPPPRRTEEEISEDLIEAALSGDAQTVKTLIAGYRQTNPGDLAKLLRTQNGVRTPLHEAAIFGYTEIVRLLIDFLRETDSSSLPAFLDTQDRFGRTALQSAVRKGHAEIAKLLIDAYLQADPKGLSKFIAGRDKNGDKALAIAIAKANVETIRVFMDAYRKADPENLREFLSRPMEYKAVPHDVTALYHAVTMGHMEIVKILVNAYLHVDPDHLPQWLRKPERRVDNALHAALRNNRFEIFSFLVDAYRQADPDGLAAFLEAPDSVYQDTSLHWAAAWPENAESIKFIIDAYRAADPGNLLKFISLGNKHQDTALHVGITTGRVEIIKALMDPFRQASSKNLARFLRSRGEYGQTALHRAAKEGHTDIVSLLIDAYRQADPNGLSTFLELQDAYQNTALHSAAEKGHVAVVKTLLNAHRRIDPAGLSALLKAENRFQQTPLQSSLLPLSLQKPHAETVFLLLRAAGQTIPEELKILTLSLFQNDNEHSYPLARYRSAAWAALETSLAAHGIPRRAPPENPENEIQYAEYVSYLQRLAFSNAAVKALIPAHLTGDSGSFYVSPLLPELMKQGIHHGKDYSTWERHQGKILANFSLDEARSTKDMFQAVAREVVLAGLVRELQELGPETYQKVATALTGEGVTQIVEELAPSVAEAIIREASLAESASTKRGEGKTVLNVLELARDWHKQIHGPLRRVRTIPLKGVWHSLLLDDKDREISSVEVKREGEKEQPLPEAIDGWSIVVLHDGQALQQEGSRMDHCVAGFGNECLAGKTHVLSIRDKQGDGRATVGIEVASRSNSAGRTFEIPGRTEVLRVFQNHGKRNAAVAGEVHRVLDWLEGRIAAGKIRINAQKGAIARDDEKTADPLLQAVGYDPSERVPYAELRGKPSEGPPVPRAEAAFRLYSEILFTPSGMGNDLGVQAGGHRLFRPFGDAEEFYTATGLQARARQALLRQLPFFRRQDFNAWAQAAVDPPQAEPSGSPKAPGKDAGSILTSVKAAARGLRQRLIRKMGNILRAPAGSRRAEGQE